MLRRARLSCSEMRQKYTSESNEEPFTLLLVAESPILHLWKRLNNAICDEASWAISERDWRTNRKRSATEDHVSAASDYQDENMSLILLLDKHTVCLQYEALVQRSRRGGRTVATTRSKPFESQRSRYPLKQLGPSLRRQPHPSDGSSSRQAGSIT
jgi:hypothetical protein